jgi:hypothetical protein
MLKAILILLALAVVFVVLLRLLERRSRSKLQGRDEDARLERSDDEEDRDESERGEPSSADERFESLVAALTRGGDEEAAQASQKLLMVGPRAVSFLLPAFTQNERKRRNRERAVVARRIEETLAAFGPSVVRPCLELLVEEKANFELFRGVRCVLANVGEAAARPLIDSLPWLLDEGLYVRAMLLMRSIGPTALSPLLRVIEGGEARVREVSLDLLLDWARFFPEVVGARAVDAFKKERRGMLAAPEVRHALLLALRRTGAAGQRIPVLLAATTDEDPRVRREAWLLCAEAITAGVGASDIRAAIDRAAPSLDREDAVAASQIYALGAIGCAIHAQVSGRAAIALAALRAKAGDSSAHALLESALVEGPLEERREAARALAFVGDEDAGRTLGRALLQTPVPILGSVVAALGSTRTPAAAAALFDLWEERLGNTIRRGITALGPAATSKLLEFVARRNPRLMEPAALVLGELGPAARDAIVTLLRDAGPDDPALFAAEIALEVHGAEATADLIALLATNAPHQREVAIWVLSHVGGVEAADALLGQLEHWDDPYPILDYVRRGPAETRARARSFAAGHPNLPDRAALEAAAHDGTP